METFPALLAIFAGNSPVTGEFPAQRPVTRSFDVFFHLRLNKRLRKQWWGWWLRRYYAHYDVIVMCPYIQVKVADIWIIHCFVQHRKNYRVLLHSISFCSSIYFWLHVMWFRHSGLLESSRKLNDNFHQTVLNFHFFGSYGRYIWVQFNIVVVDMLT